MWWKTGFKSPPDILNQSFTTSQLCKYHSVEKSGHRILSLMCYMFWRRLSLLAGWLRWKTCLAFPAVLNLEGVYSRMGPYFTLFDEINVSFYIILTEEISLIPEFQRLIPSPLRSTKAAFQSSPLSDTPSSGFLKDAKERSEMAMKILQTISTTVEQKIQNRLHSRLWSFILCRLIIPSWFTGLCVSD